MEREADENIWVFLSHSNEDYEKVRIVRNYLEEKQFRPIMFYLKCLNDEEEVDDLIKREIDSRNRFVLCDSKNAKKSKWVKTEVDYIKSKERMYQVIDLEKSIESIKMQIDTFIFRSSVFVSYSHNDERLAKSIIKELKKHDFRILYSEKNLLTSGSLTESLTNNIEEASKKGYVLILLSKYSVKNQFVLCETQYALNLSKRRDNIIPIVIESDIWEYIPQFLKSPNESPGQEILAFDVSNYREKDIPSIITARLLNLDYDSFVNMKSRSRLKRILPFID